MIYQGIRSRSPHSLSFSGFTSIGTIFVLQISLQPDEADPPDKTASQTAQFSGMRGFVRFTVTHWISVSWWSSSLSNGHILLTLRSY